MTVSAALSEALRAEIRTALEADGKPFSIAVARRVYDLAIAGRDLLVAASGNSVGSAIEAVEDSQGPLDSVTGPSATPAPTIVAETFGARMIRELMASLSMLRNATRSEEDPRALVHALAEARQHGMTDVANELEKKLFGRVLGGPHFDPNKHKPGCLARNFGEDRECDLDCDKLPHINLGGPVVVHRMDGPNCEAQGKCEDIKGDGTCFGCGRWLGDDENAPEKSGRTFERPRSGAENAFAPDFVVDDGGGAS